MQKPDTHTYWERSFVCQKGVEKKAWRAAIVDKGVGYSGGCSADPVYKAVK